MRDCRRRLCAGGFAERNAGRGVSAQCGMVFTVRVRWADQRYSRRVALGAAGGLAVAALSACDLVTAGSAGTAPSAQQAPDPLRPLLDATLALEDRYSRTIAAIPALAARLAPLAADHREHAVALAKEIGQPAAASPSATVSATVSASPSATASTSVAVPGDPAAAVAALATAEKAAQENAAVACLAAPWYRAALLGSIAACRASHLEALR
jgi:hypothetical protein